MELWLIFIGMHFCKLFIVCLLWGLSLWTHPTCRRTRLKKIENLLKYAESAFQPVIFGPRRPSLKHLKVRHPPHTLNFRQPSAASANRHNIQNAFDLNQFQQSPETSKRLELLEARLVEPFRTSSILVYAKYAIGEPLPNFFFLHASTRSTVTTNIFQYIPAATFQPHSISGSTATRSWILLLILAFKRFSGSCSII